MNINDLKMEIDRCFRVLGADRGFDQNATDIIAWHREGFISEDEYVELRSYNRKQYAKLPLDA